jgi:hypothetical protein
MVLIVLLVIFQGHCDAVQSKNIDRETIHVAERSRWIFMRNLRFAFVTRRLLCVKLCPSTSSAGNCITRQIVVMYSAVYMLTMTRMFRLNRKQNDLRLSKVNQT